jgi:hypothetical protein
MPAILFQEVALIVVGEYFAISVLSNWLNLFLTAFLLIKLIKLSDWHWLFNVKKWKTFDMSDGT